MVFASVLTKRMYTYKMKRLVGIFAHPDDEALGPSGALATFAKDHDVYLICVTAGEASGTTEEEKRSIAETRRAELLHSAETLGVKDVYFLGYCDGDLSNNLYHKLAADVQTHLEKLQPEKLMTFHQLGVSGHIDHITVSLVTTFVFHKLPFIKELYYYCISQEKSNEMKDYFVFVPPGIRREDADKIIDVSSVWETKVKAMKCHESQIQDVKRTLEFCERSAKEEYFLVARKPQ